MITKSGTEENLPLSTDGCPENMPNDTTTIIPTNEFMYSITR